ncbi:hypothetical protein [Burkholderia cepacia]|uniref:hypothetical protein n=1 Tax=Burkholderia cepacia TaxID=292 RepID=UPI000F5B7009|nr:hypothetical protein [Burkholderia cepacia]
MSAVDPIQDMSDVAEAKNDSIDDCEQRRFRGGGRDNSSAPASEAGCKRTEMNPANQGAFQCVHCGRNFVGLSSFGVSARRVTSVSIFAAPSEFDPERVEKRG